MQTRQIFIALDDYQLPNPVMEYGIHLAKALEAHARLVAIEQLHLEMTPTSIAQTDIYQYQNFEMTEVIDAVKPDVKALTERAKEIWQDVSYSLEAGFRESTLIEKSEEERPQLVVVQRKSNLTTLNEWFGTHETRLAHNIPNPVLVVPKETTWKPVGQILYVLDLADDAVENMRLLHFLAARLKAHLNVAIVAGDEVKENNPTFLTAVAMFRQLSSHEQVTYIQVFTKQAADTVASLVTETQADWLVFQDKDRSFISRLFDHYNNAHLILQSEIPVLVI